MCFALLAEAEALLRSDFDARVARGEKGNPVRRAFKGIKRDHGRKIRLDEHILGTWAAQPTCTRSVAAFRGALSLRNWLAHGRHWDPNLGGAYGTLRVFEIVSDLFTALGVPGWLSN